MNNVYRKQREKLVVPAEKEVNLCFLENARNVVANWF